MHNHKQRSHQPEARLNNPTPSYTNFKTGNFLTRLPEYTHIVSESCRREFIEPPPEAFKHSSIISKQQQSSICIYIYIAAQSGDKNRTLSDDESVCGQATSRLTPCGSAVKFRWANFDTPAAGGHTCCCYCCRVTARNIPLSTMCRADTLRLSRKCIAHELYTI